MTATVDERKTCVGVAKRGELINKSQKLVLDYLTLTNGAEKCVIG